MNQRDGSVSKGGCHQVLRPMLELQDPQREKKESTTTHCPLTSICMSWHACTCAQIQSTGQLINRKQLQKI